jgi:hypothetical protein
MRGHSGVISGVRERWGVKEDSVQFAINGSKLVSAALHEVTPTFVLLAALL